MKRLLLLMLSLLLVLALVGCGKAKEEPDADAADEVEGIGIGSQFFGRVPRRVHSYKEERHVLRIAAQVVQNRPRLGQSRRTYIGTCGVAEKDQHDLVLQVAELHRLAALAGQRELRRGQRLGVRGSAIRVWLAAADQQNQRRESSSQPG